MNAETEILVKAINSFFYVYLPKQRCYSRNTVDSYKTAFNLFLDYMLEQRDSPLHQMTLADLNKDNLSGFVDWLATVRQNSPGTCNQRLMAFRSFAKHLGIKDFALASVYADVCSVPTKKKTTKVVDFLSEEGLKTLLIQPDTSKRTGIRNQCFMCLMYDTAARCQELLDSRLNDLSLSGNAPFIYLTGKGNKTRAVPLMKTIVNHLLNYLKIFHPDSKNQMDAYLFYTTSHGEHHPMSLDTVQLFMKEYGRTAREVCPEIPEQVHPHQLRHTRAIHLYRGGMPLSILSEFLGHASEETTRIYAYADTEMKRKAIEKATPKAIPGNETPIWDASDDATLRRLAGLR